MDLLDFIADSLPPPEKYTTFKQDVSVGEFLKYTQNVGQLEGNEPVYNEVKEELLML